MRSVVATVEAKCVAVVGDSLLCAARRCRISMIVGRVARTRYDRAQRARRQAPNTNGTACSVKKKKEGQDKGDGGQTARRVLGLDRARPPRSGDDQQLPTREKKAGGTKKMPGKNPPRELAINHGMQINLTRARLLCVTRIFSCLVVVVFRTGNSIDARLGCTRLIDQSLGWLRSTGMSKHWSARLKARRVAFFVLWRL